MAGENQIPDLPSVLAKLSLHDMHVHQYEEEECCSFKVLAFGDTHFVMQGSEVVFSGSVEGVVNFVRRLPTDLLCRC